MAKNASVFQMGGGGFDYEHYVQSAFLTSLILQSSIPVFPNCKVQELGFQCKRKGYETDDLFLKVKNGKNEHRIINQIKYNVSISEKSEIFFDVIKAFWKDFNNYEIFDKEKDCFFLIKSSLTNVDKNQVVVLLDWAVTHKDEEDFYIEVERIDVKNNTLKMLSNLLKRANDEVELSKKQIWEFLKCFKLIAFDFTTQNSISQTYILDLIKLSKSTDLTPIEIWNTILAKASEYNRNGGSITSESLKTLDLYKYFDLSRIQEAYISLNKLRDDSSLVVKPLKNNINGYHINRDETRLSILNSINNNSITFITGTPGVGKSAIMKELLEKQLKKTIPFIFKADQFNKSTLSQVLSEIGISHNLLELFSTISLLQDKIIIIDSAEKLLEGDSDNAFKQLLSLVNETKGLKLLLTSRSYAINVIIQKFGINQDKINIIEIPTLNDTELEAVSLEFPQLKSLLQNKNIKEILRSPKYLEFGLNAISKEDFKTKEISLSEFKNKLWYHIIENGTVIRNGIGRKRGKAFSHIAIGRAINMQLFYEPNDEIVDYSEAIDMLIDDDIIIRNKNLYEFAPSHDIFEDWALVRYISSIEKQTPNKDTFFNELGNQPALRRAFRLWIEDSINNDIEIVINLVNESINNHFIERYWVDEILTAIFRSSDCEMFFNQHKTTLLENDCAFLNRCILLTRTTCREYNFSKENSNDILFPVGSVWREILHFIAIHIDIVRPIRNSIIGLLFEWELNFIFFENSCSSKEIAAACNIIITYIKEIEKQDEFWSNSFDKDNRENLIFMLFGFSPYAIEEIEFFLKRCKERTSIESYWRSRDFDQLVLKKALGGVRNQKLIKYTPDLLIDLASKYWKERPAKESSKQKSSFPFDFPERKERKESWGVEEYRFDFFPSGIYKTFVYNLFLNHSSKAIKFIINFTNYMTLSYSNSEYAKTDNLKLIEIKLSDGTTTKLYSNSYLWNAYRGTSGSHDLLECILISFEKYLLQLAKLSEGSNKKLFNSIVYYCLKNSNSVSIISVITSTFIAYPKAFDDLLILPILKIKEFHELDFNRATLEYSTMAIADNSISYAQKEKFEFNNLPHRRKYSRGLREFILHHQLTIGKLNKYLFEIFDKFYEECSDTDILWRKAINEMDSRKYKTSNFDNEKGTFQLEVVYEKEVQAIVKDFTEDWKDEGTSLSFSNIMHKLKDSSESISFEKWEEIYNHYSSQKSQTSFYNLPNTLSAFGLENFSEKLNPTQKNWCLSSISNTIGEIIKNKFSRNYEFNNFYNILELQHTIESIHLLFHNIENPEQQKEIEILSAYLLICPLENHEQRDFNKYIREKFTDKSPKESFKLWLLLVSYAEFSRVNSAKHYRSKEEELIFRKKQDEYIEKCIDDNIEIHIDSLNFETYEAHYLILGLLMIPVGTENRLLQDYILKVSELIINDLKLEEGDSYHHRSKKDRSISAENLIDIRFYLNEVLMFNNIELGKKLINILINPFFENDINLNNNTLKDLYELTTGVFDTTVTRFDDIIITDIESDIQKYGNHFWKLWQFLYERVVFENKLFFRKQLLLDVNTHYWTINSNSWKGFLDKKHFYKEMIIGFGDSSLPNIINVFSSFGEQEFLPEGISVIAEFIKSNSENKKFLISDSSKKLIKILFNNHINKIKNNQTLISDFIFILNIMIDIGVSEAYLIRECVIVYKVNSK